MRILHAQPAKRPSRRIDDLNSEKDKILSTAREMTDLLFSENKLKSSQGRAGLALHHAQVTSEPLALFVVLPGIIPAKDGQATEVGAWDTIMINAEIIDKKNRTTMKEGCMSFPQRSDKKMERYNEVIVNYVTVENDEFIKRNRTLYGIQAQIFQHECEHQAGRNIYMKG